MSRFPHRHRHIHLLFLQQLVLVNYPHDHHDHQKNVKTYVALAFIQDSPACNERMLFGLRESRGSQHLNHATEGEPLRDLLATSQHLAKLRTAELLDM